MKRSGNKVLIIVLIVIALLSVAGGAFAYLYLATDMFRTGQELFAKYLTQNIGEITQTVSLNKIDELENKLKQSLYEENITVSFAEGEEQVAQITIDTQNDSINKKHYGIIGLDLDNNEEDTLEIEYMQEDDMYSLRFTNAVKQFLTVQNSDLTTLAKNLGMDEEAVEQTPDTIDFESLSLEKLELTDEEKNAEIKKYSELLYNNISEQKYTKNKNTVITVHGKTITTNAYVLTLNEQDIETLLIKLLETLKQDEIILSKLQSLDEAIQEYSEYSLKDNFVQTIEEMLEDLTQEEADEESLEEAEETQKVENTLITIYEENGKTVRVKLEQGLKYITLDTIEAEGKKQIEMNYTSIDEDNTQLSNEIVIVKESENKLNLQYTNIDGEERNSIQLNIELKESEGNTKLDATVKMEEAQIIFSRNINFVNEIDYEVVLDKSNNIILNELTQEQITAIFNALEEPLTLEYIEPLETILTPILSILLLNQAHETVENADFSQVESEM